jgi:hypothetical protein
MGWLKTGPPNVHARFYKTTGGPKKQGYTLWGQSMQNKLLKQCGMLPLAEKGVGLCLT